MYIARAEHKPEIFGFRVQIPDYWDMHPSEKNSKINAPFI